MFRWKGYSSADQEKLYDEMRKRDIELARRKNVNDSALEQIKAEQELYANNKFDDIRNDDMISDLESELMDKDELNTRLAINEMRKFNNSDPTSFWRWKQDKDDIRLANEQRLLEEKAEENKAFELERENALTKKLNPNEYMGFEQINALQTLINKGKMSGKYVSDLVARLDELNNEYKLAHTNAETSSINDEKIKAIIARSDLDNNEKLKKIQKEFLVTDSISLQSEIDKLKNIQGKTVAKKTEEQKAKEWYINNYNNGKTISDDVWKDMKSMVISDYRKTLKK